MPPDSIIQTSQGIPRFNPAEICSNAAEAMSAVPDGSRVLNINSKLRQPDEVVIAFEDCGPGVDPKIMDRIFDSFFTTKPQGMGMGLSVCRSIIEAHKGRLWVSSSSDHGSVFNVRLPVIDAAVE